ncbi:MAG: sensor histidine kinase [Bacteroidota bacterium]
MSRFLTLLLLAASLAANAQTKEEHVLAGIIKEEEGYLDAALQEYRLGLPLPGALNGVASIETALGKYDSVPNYLARSRSLDSSSNNLIKNYQVEARYWQALNDYDRGVSFLQRALDHAVSVNDVRSRAIILSSMGNMYFSHEPDMKIVRSYLERSNALCDSSVHYNIIARNYARIANTYFVVGDGVKANQYLARAKKISDLSPNLPLRAYILSTIAINLFEEGRYRECLALMQEPIRIRRELGQKRGLQNDLLNISETYMMVNDYDNARKAIEEGMSISRSLKDVIYLKYFYERASALDSTKGNYKSAFSNLKHAMAYKDSAFSAQRVKDVKEIQQKYEAEQKEKIIAEKELEIEQHKYQLATVSGLAITAIMSLVVVFLTVRARSRRQHDHLRLQTIIKTQEEVQQRIARDLHDGIVQILGAAKMSLQSVGPTTDHSVVQKHIRDASDIVDEAINETRSVSHEILPYSLIKDGLVSALEDLFSRSLSSYKFDHSMFSIRVNNEITIHLYRIVQELVNNVKKHASSAHVIVVLISDSASIKLYFSDNGTGFEGSPSDGVGLINIQTRTELMKGTFKITSRINSGTKAEVIIPL